MILLRVLLKTLVEKSSTRSLTYHLPQEEQESKCLVSGWLAWCHHNETMKPLICTFLFRAVIFAAKL